MSTPPLPPNGRHWTADEDALLRELYVVRGGARRLADQLQRSLHSVHRRARRLNVKRYTHWSSADVAKLKQLWGDHSVETVARMMGRSPEAVYWRAQKHGLTLGCPQGYEYLSHAAKRAGFPVGTLRRILRLTGHSGSIRRAITRTRVAPGSSRHVHWVVDSFAVDEAVEQWLSTEPLEAACRRLGVGRAWLMNRLVGRPDVPARPQLRKATWRVPSAVVDRVVAEARGAA